MERGLFIAFEGIDGSGKSTQVKMLANILDKDGKDVMITREPGGTRIGAQLRKLLLDAENKEMVFRAEALLYAADRAQHVEEKILPALQKGKIVICDRYTDSTIAYQGGGRGMDGEILVSLNEIATAGLYADLVLILDVSPEIGLRRVKANDIVDRLESENLKFYQRVRKTYLELAAYNGRYRVINANLSPEDVHMQVLCEVRKLLNG